MRMFSWLNGLKQRFFRGDSVSRRRHRPIPVAAMVAAERLEERVLLSAVSWDGGAGDTNWQNPLNWSGDQLPGADDDVTIDVAGSDVTIVNVGGTVHSLASAEAIAINGGTLDVSAASSVAALSLNGAIAGTGDLTITGLFNWTGGVLSGSGSLTANGGMEISNFYYVQLNGKTLNNAGTALWRAGHIFASNGAVINNLADADFQVEKDVDIVYQGQGARPIFHNAGRFRKTGDAPTGWQDYGSGTSLDGVFDNTGTVEVLAGTLSFYDLGANVGVVTTGDFTGAAGTSLALARGNLSSAADVHGDYVALNGVSIAGDYVANTTNVQGGAVFTGTVASGHALVVSYGGADYSLADTDTPITFSSINLSGGIGGTTDLIVTGLFNWTGGVLSGSGELTANGGMEISNFYYVQLNGKTLNNAGTALWRAGHIFASNGAVINNLADADFQVEKDVDIVYQGQGARPIFHNAGRFRKTGDAPTGWQDYGSGTSLDGVFDNTGTVEVLAGQLNFSNFTQTAGATILNGGTVSSGMPLDFQGGSLAGSGSVFAHVSNSGAVSPGFSAGVIAFYGNYLQNAAGSYEVELGTPSDQVQVFGTVTLAGTLDVSLIGGFVPANNQVFTIIDNDGAESVSGIFDGLAEGGLVTSGGWQFEISYVGGDGNDVTLRSINQPPVADAGGPYLVVRGGTVQLDASATMDPNEPNTSLNYAWDFDGDAQFDDAVGIAPVFSADGIEALGTRTIAVQVTDAGGLTSVSTTTVEIVAVALLPDSCHPGETALVVGGTLGDDTILFTPDGSGGDVVVQLNGVTLGTYHPTGRLIAYGQDGNDEIQVAGSLNLSAWLYGGLGDDRLKGGAGNDVLFGDDGDDQFVGGSGRDLLVGGDGADQIVGNVGDDILIGGSLNFASLEPAVCDIMAEWTSDRDYLTRIANLEGTGTGPGFAARRNGNFFLQGGATVIRDLYADVLTGSAGADWFFFDPDRDRVNSLIDEAFSHELDLILS